jgi:EAL domain-containing protein (putative c-di-GMP-specific phosphodiesterase class I)/GGDEF domain-containing protein
LTGGTNFAAAIIPPGLDTSVGVRAPWQVPSVESLTREEWEEGLARRLDLLAQTGGVRIAMFVIELPGLIQIAETFGSRVHHSLLQEAVTRLAEAFGPETMASHSDYSVVLAIENIGEDDVTSVAQMVHLAIRQCRSDAGVKIVGVPLIGAALYAQGGQASIPLPPASHSRVHVSRHPAGQSGRTVVSCLIRRAELALHRASRGQDGSCTLYTPMLKARLREETEMRQRLLHAIDRQEFTLAYQPIVDLSRATTVGFEALIRWQSEIGTLCGGPAEFIPIAEETGLIVPIGAQVISTAMKQAAAWRAEGLTPPRIAVNVSAEQLADARFLETVRDSLEKEGLPPSAIELELTERTLVTSATNTIRLLEHLQQIGVVVSVDDFGTGYSALRYLQDLPISKLKIDRSFVMRLTNLPREQAMVKAMISLAASFDLDVVAEGIETHEQLDILRGLGCASGQGYLFSQALPAAQAKAWIGSAWRTPDSSSMHASC